ncbi:MAG TPA: VWA domain-containing protein [Pyrinomonadaceae bacterium]
MPTSTVDATLSELERSRGSRLRTRSTGLLDMVGIIQEAAARSFVIAVMLIAAVSCAPDSLTAAQAPPPERPRLKDFGSSLKRPVGDNRKPAKIEKTGDTNEDDVIRVETNLVVSSVQVRDKNGRIINGLTKEDFIITEDGRLQDIHHFSLGNDQSVGRTIVLLIDYSGSQAPYIQKSVAAAKMLVDQLGPRDVMAVVTDDVKLLVDFTQDKSRLKQKLESLQARSEDHNFGRSQQFSALMATVREMFSDEDMRPIVIFQTDGDEVFSLRPSTPPILNIPSSPYPRPNVARPVTSPRESEFPKSPTRQPMPGDSSRGEPADNGILRVPPPLEYKIPGWSAMKYEPPNFSLRDLYNAIETSRVSVYTIIPGPQLVRARTEKELEVPSGWDAVKTHLFWGNVAAAGAAIGGWTAYLETPEKAADIYAQILTDIESRYVIGYYPINRVHDGKRRRVVVEVRNHPEYSVSGRKSYIAPAPID